MKTELGKMHTLVQVTNLYSTFYVKINNCFYESINCHLHNKAGKYDFSMFYVHAEKPP